MGYVVPDVYNQPEAFGLTQVVELDGSVSYDYCYLVVWQHEDGRLFWARDEGCSCTSPFEDYTSLDKLDGITADTWDEFAAAVADFHPWRPDNLAADRTAMLAKVGGILHGIY